MIPHRRRALGGLTPTLGFALTYLSLIVLIPLAALVLRPLAAGWDGIVAAVTAPRVLAALRLSFGLAAAAALIAGAAGLLIAWVLTRYRFPGRRLVDALIDLPFALPTAVAGISLAALYGPQGWIGAWAKAAGIKIAFTPWGALVALVFIGLPFVVRSVQHVLDDIDPEVEEAAATLGAGRVQTVLRVVLPAILPGLLAGLALAFARALGEYGSVIFIAGNLPMVSEIAPLLIVIKLEQFDYAGAAAIGTVMLLTAFALLLAMARLERWSVRWG